MPAKARLSFQSGVDSWLMVYIRTHNLVFC